MEEKTEKKIRVRRYTEKDLPEMIRIWNEVVEEGIAFPQEECLDRETGKDFFDAQTYCGVAEDEKGRVLGLYILHPNNVGRCGHICNTSYAVRRDMRGQHIGGQLVRHSMKMGKELGFRILQFNAVVADNYPALRLYKKLGFTQLGVIPEGFLAKDGIYRDIIPHYRKL